MSLILTQSDSTPGSNPASYVNRFKNTFQIKANAEIAVQEVVLNRTARSGTAAPTSPSVVTGCST